MRRTPWTFFALLAGLAASLTVANVALSRGGRGVSRGGRSGGVRSGRGTVHYSGRSRTTSRRTSSSPPRKTATKVSRPANYGSVRHSRVATRPAARRGKGISQLPSGATRIRVGKGYRYRWGNNFYRPYYDRGDVLYFVEPPPAGTRLTVLPEGYVARRINGRLVYVYDNYTLEYSAKDGRAGYVVVEPPGGPAVKEPAEEPDPFDLLREMSNYLASQQYMVFTTSDTFDQVLESGKKVQMSSKRTVYVSRPNKVVVEYSGDGKQRRVAYNGKTLTVFDRK